MSAETGRRVDTAGVVAGVAAYSFWGFFPAFFPLLEPAGPVEILAHRVVWTLVVMGLVLVVTRRAAELRRLDVRTWGLVVAAAALISVNWGTYIYTVNSSRVSEAALGYFINPLVSVLLGVAIFGERLRRPQLVAVGMAVVAVAVLTVGYGHVPWLSLVLAASFGLYGVVKKMVRATATVSLAAEVVVTTPVALVYLGWLTAQGRSTFLGHGAGHTALLALCGVVTAVPLLCFGVAAQRIPLALVGMLQYLTPTLQLAWAVFHNHEPLDGTQWFGFVIVLAAVVLFSGSQVAAVGLRARPAAAGAGPTLTGSNPAADGEEDGVRGG